jgi:hypothetical protein
MRLCSKQRAALGMLFILAIRSASQEMPSKNAPTLLVAGTVLVSPVDPTVTTGGTIQFAAQIVGQPGVLANWSVNGNPGGNDDSGRITATGLYTAPASIPDNAPKVTAASPLDKTQSMSVSVTVTATSCPSTGSGKQPSPCLTIDPPTKMVKLGEKDTRFSLKVANWPGGASQVRWFVNGVLNGTPATGTIQGTGTNVSYVLPTTAVPPKKLEIKATAILDTAHTATAQVIVVASYVSVRCFAGENRRPGDKCRIIDFDRLDGPRGSFDKQPVADDTSARLITAVNSSKALFTGSVLDLDLPDGANEANCKNYDWKIVTQSTESPNVLIYNPGDVGAGVCVGNKFVIALPVRALWADVSGFPQLPDPQRSGPADVATFKDCWGNNVPQTIAPCDRHAGLMAAIYKNGWVYTHFSQAGSAQGTISLSPVIGTGQRQLSFDVLADPAYKLGPGWLNIPLIFEKSTSQGANLDSLILGLAYDVRFLRHPNVSESSHLVVRKPQFQVRSGTEIAPTTPHDKNWVEAGTIRFPLIFNFHQQPSAFTAYPVVGVEGGSHFDTHLAENDPILRGVAGVDGSFRWPFNLTHNFLGSSPITLEYSYRVRWLAYAEPTTDVANNGMEILAGGRRSFLRGSITEPLTANLQFQVTALRGSLAPDFRALGNTVVIGLTFTNPGSSEH